MSKELDAPKISVPFDQFQVSSLVYWIEANGYKPHLIVRTAEQGLRLPPHLMVSPLATLNVASAATHRFQWLNDRMEFNARFNGVDFRLIVPYRAINLVGFAGTKHYIPMPWIGLPAKIEQVEPPKVVEDTAKASTPERRQTTVTELSTDKSKGLYGADPKIHGNVVKVDFTSPHGKK